MGACMYRSACHRNTLDRGGAHVALKLEDTQQDLFQGTKVDILGSPAVGVAGKLPQGVVASKRRLWPA